jgi:hypothetical protein
MREDGFQFDQWLLTTMAADTYEQLEAQRATTAQR